MSAGMVERLREAQDMVRLLLGNADAAEADAAVIKLLYLTMRIRCDRIEAYRSAVHRSILMKLGNNPLPNMRQKPFPFNAGGVFVCRKTFR